MVFKITDPGGRPSYTVLGSTFGIAFGMMFFSWIGLVGGVIIGVAAGVFIESRPKDKVKSTLFKYFLALCLIGLGILNFHRWFSIPENSTIVMVYFISGAIFIVLGILLLRKAYRIQIGKEKSIA